MRAMRAVLWDMDGTLIDSEEFHWIAWRDTLASEGVKITKNQFLATFGQRNDSIIPQLLGGDVTSDTVERVGNSKEKRYRDMIRRKGIAPLPGVARWVHHLHDQGWRQAVASAAPRANIDAVLKAVSAADVFEGIVAAEDVRRGKPDPEVFLAAASRVGVPPERCIVVEDAPAGVEAARRAGMKSIGISRNGKSLSADIVVESLDLLGNGVFEELLNR